jgi:RHS repeat-associated protein
MVTACSSSNCSGATMSASYAYDPLGRRESKTVNGTTTYYLNDGSDILGEYQSNKAVLRRYIPGPAINEPIAYENCQGATTPNCTGSGPVDEYFHTDHHGSVLTMSGSSGNSASDANGGNPFTYDAYGNTTASLSGEPFHYVGMYYDSETGLYFDRARYYSPTLGRFMQDDPLLYKDDLDLYTYVGNDPTDKVDPSGTTCTVKDGTADCKMDKEPDTRGMNLDEKAAVQRGVKAFNKRYSDTVNKLLKSGKTTDLTLPQKTAEGGIGGNVSMSISSTEVANALVSRIIAYDGSVTNAHTDVYSNTTYISDAIFRGQAAPKFGGVAPGSEGSNTVLTHEGIHGTQTENALMRKAGVTERDMDADKPWGAAHQPFYDAAAIALYGQQ